MPSKVKDWWNGLPAYLFGEQEPKQDMVGASQHLPPPPGPANAGPEIPNIKPKPIGVGGEIPKVNPIAQGAFSPQDRQPMSGPTGAGPDQVLQPSRRVPGIGQPVTDKHEGEWVFSADEVQAIGPDVLQGMSQAVRSGNFNVNSIRQAIGQQPKVGLQPGTGVMLDGTQVGGGADLGGIVTTPPAAIKVITQKTNVKPYDRSYGVPGPEATDIGAGTSQVGPTAEEMEAAGQTPAAIASQNAAAAAEAERIAKAERDALAARTRPAPIPFQPEAVTAPVIEPIKVDVPPPPPSQATQDIETSTQYIRDVLAGKSPMVEATWLRAVNSLTGAGAEQLAALRQQLAQAGVSDEGRAVAMAAAQRDISGQTSKLFGDIGKEVLGMQEKAAETLYTRGVDSLERGQKTYNYLNGQLNSYLAHPEIPGNIEKAQEIYRAMKNSNYQDFNAGLVEPNWEGMRSAQVQGYFDPPGIANRLTNAGTGGIVPSSLLVNGKVPERLMGEISDAITSAYMSGIIDKNGDPIPGAEGTVDWPWNDPLHHFEYYDWNGTPITAGTDINSDAYREKIVNGSNGDPIIYNGSPLTFGQAKTLFEDAGFDSDNPKYWSGGRFLMDKFISDTTTGAGVGGGAGYSPTQYEADVLSNPDLYPSTRWMLEGQDKNIFANLSGTGTTIIGADGTSVDWSSGDSRFGYVYAQLDQIYGQPPGEGNLTSSQVSVLLKGGTIQVDKATGQIKNVNDLTERDYSNFTDGALNSSTVSDWITTEDYHEEDGRQGYGWSGTARASINAAAGQTIEVTAADGSTHYYQIVSANGPGSRTSNSTAWINVKEVNANGVSLGTGRLRVDGLWPNNFLIESDGTASGGFTYSGTIAMHK